MVPFVTPYSQAAVDELRFRLRRHDGPKPFVAPGLPRVWIVNSSKTCARGYWMDAFDWKGTTGTSLDSPSICSEFGNP